jgi:hypothetical protein
MQDFEKYKGPTIELTKEELSDLFPFIDSSIKDNFLKLPDNVQDEIEDKMYLFVYSQFLSIYIFKHYEESTPIGHDNIRNIINYFSPEIAITMMETYLRARLCLREYDNPEIPDLICERVEKIVLSMSDDTNQRVIEVMERFEQLEYSKKRKTIKRVKIDLLKTRNKLINANKLLTNLEIDSLNSFIQSISKTFFEARINLIDLRDDSKDSDDTIVEIDMPDEEINEFIESWERRKKIHFLVLRSGSEKEKLSEFFEIIKEQTFEYLSNESTTTINLDGDIFIKIPNAETHDIKGFIEELLDNKKLEKYELKIAYSLFDKSHFAERQRQSNKDVKTFIQDIVIDSILNHLIKGMKNAYSKSGAIVASGSEILTADAFSYKEKERLEATVLTTLIPLMSFEAFDENGDPIEIPIQEEVRADTPKTIKPGRRIETPQNPTVIGIKRGTAEARTDKEPDTARYQDVPTKKARRQYPDGTTRLKIIFDASEREESEERTRNSRTDDTPIIRISDSPRASDYKTPESPIKFDE